MELRGRTYGIIGAARSGVAVAVLLKNRGAEVFVSDSAPAEKLRQSLDELARHGIAYECGANTEKILDYDLIVVSPGVPTDIPILRKARELGRTIVGELEIASRFFQGTIVAITGTNGKTTTTALVGRIFEDARRPSVVAGNIGNAFSLVADQLTSNHTAILEVSSFQLDTIETFRPRVSVLLNITPDHLDRYDHSMEKYISSKCRVFMNQQAGDSIVYNYDDPLVRANVEQRVHPAVRKLPFSLGSLPEGTEGVFIHNKTMVVQLDGQRIPVIDVESISIKGTHNLMNAMAASMVAKVLSIPTASLRATLRNFKGVEHRLEFVRELNGVSYVNDSKATNVDSVWYALQSFTSPIVLLLGGRDKGNDYSRLVPLVQAHVRAIIAIGESADKVVSAFASVV
ncbi:MAG TPA: UDP-N-acetylmuramoyl-L-alanine--D-glutamate ligase, partial [Bacteroidota bacterium]|nr:UDP-N-acetylmuramoyl-L-alanine--D-glutamate ligase [Bacteroidota bacterium]